MATGALPPHELRVQEEHRSIIATHMNLMTLHAIHPEVGIVYRKLVKCDLDPVRIGRVELQVTSQTVRFSQRMIHSLGLFEVSGEPDECVLCGQ